MCVPLCPLKEVLPLFCFEMFYFPLFDLCFLDFDTADKNGIRTWKLNKNFY